MNKLVLFNQLASVISLLLLWPCARLSHNKYIKNPSCEVLACKLASQNFILVVTIGLKMYVKMNLFTGLSH